ncbi:helix-turn-helix transcriptional regulator [Streptomyces pacificus]|uniref:helix-turn-helix transcriptional regulator n=1 Tax=Streptomyces pacificus TaxID=2705029 RepID=UPI0015666629|nr:helix-turn-helix transcriptional regulator [Streptomyces pacificus]
MSSDPLPDWVLTRRRAIGARIRSRRLTQNLTQERLGELVAIDSKTVHRIEYAISDPPLSTVLRIAHALDLAVEDLLRDDAPARPRRGTQGDRGSTSAT